MNRPMQEKASIVAELRSFSALGSGINKYNAPMKLAIGRRMSTNMNSSYSPSRRTPTPQLDGTTSMTPTLRNHQSDMAGTASMPTITDSMASLGLNEQRQDFKDVIHKRLILDVHEALTHQRVTVKLLIDFDQFLDLQRKLPAEY